MSASLVGSEMCIRDRNFPNELAKGIPGATVGAAPPWSHQLVGRWSARLTIGGRARTTIAQALAETGSQIEPHGRLFLGL
eukprot:3664740-Alexandrium_andersonii.AAC.1